MKYFIDGYIARICVTQPFPHHNLERYIGINDDTSADTPFIRANLADLVFVDYDRLIQFYDALPFHSGTNLP